ncbi:hypothetical protein AC629_13450 [Bradyrhizobium sp. NAS80.1]|uniref:hypothetical protein n=1 Tax=Bradyrhizobium sp. NAS80.1 TaxID=1680159 RepID=UPI00095B10A4|nr:hypothetical protein [Bradyrhizobium sp. NAS80.1]OKO87557.1 hypothetical protein AC629_13450 [Bradyrhizobium sp. NAS80.1]
MPIRRLLRDSKLTPQEIDRLDEAYAFALRSLDLVDRNDPLTEIVARKIIEIGASVHDPAEIAKTALKELRMA